MKYSLIYPKYKLDPSARAHGVTQSEPCSASHAVRAEVVAALNDNNMQKE